MPRVSVEIDVVQLPGGWLWRFRLPVDLVPQDAKYAALAGLTGPFASETAAQDHARRTLEVLVREHIRAAAVPTPQAGPPVRNRAGRRGKSTWTPEDDGGWSRNYPRDDVEIWGDVWRNDVGKHHWMVSINGTPIGVIGTEQDPHVAKMCASKVMEKISHSMR